MDAGKRTTSETPVTLGSPQMAEDDDARQVHTSRSHRASQGTWLEQGWRPVRAWKAVEEKLFWRGKKTTAGCAGCDEALENDRMICRAAVYLGLHNMINSISSHRSLLPRHVTSYRWRSYADGA
jgi:hypothetical protein